MCDAWFPSPKKPSPFSILVYWGPLHLPCTILSWALFPLEVQYISGLNVFMASLGGGNWHDTLQKANFLTWAQKTRRVAFFFWGKNEQFDGLFWGFFPQPNEPKIGKVVLWGPLLSTDVSRLPKLTPGAYKSGVFFEVKNASVAFLSVVLGLLRNII